MTSTPAHHGLRRVLATGAAIVFLSTSGHASDEAHGYHVTGDLDEAPRLYRNLGDYGRTISSDSASAQAFFDQGLRLAYGFARPDAARAFRAARNEDPDCAICYWGEAWALGPYQNAPTGVGAIEDARDAAGAALARINEVEGWERALIEAMAERYPEDGETATARYAEAMARAAAAHPDDHDVQSLYAEALMMFRPWDLHRATAAGVEPYPEAQAAIDVLEAVLAEDVAHPGACHLYIHAVEAWEPQRAEACADGLGDAIPGVSHIAHMPSHIYVHVGRYGDAVAVNQRAVRMDRAAAYDAAFSVYAGHNMAMLSFAAWLDGQSGVALAAARDLGRLHPEDGFHYDLTLARFGRWNQILERETAPDAAFQRAMWHFAQGLAQLRTGEPQAAERALDAIRATREATSEDAIYGVFGHAQRDMLGVAAYLLAGELAAANGRIDEAEGHLRRAIEIEDGFPYAEPEPWALPPRHVLGAVLLEAGRPAEAEAVHRAALQAHPNNGWSLKGLEQSLAAQGKDDEARETAAAFEQAWQRADVWLTGSRF